MISFDNSFFFDEKLSNFYSDDTFKQNLELSHLKSEELKKEFLNSLRDRSGSDASVIELTEEDIRHKELTGGRLEKLHKLREDEILFEASKLQR